MLLLLVFATTVLISFSEAATTSSTSTKQLGRACKFADGDKACGLNARCFQVSLGTGRTGLGVCWCKTKQFRQPASLPTSTRAPLQQQMGAKYWTDCVPMLRIGEQCAKNPTSSGGRNNNRKPPTGDYYYADDSDKQQTDAGAPLLPADAVCNSAGVVECKPGRRVQGDSCVPLAQAAGGAAGAARGGAGLFGEACSAQKMCDTSRGLRCMRDGGGEGKTICRCSIGNWRGDSCSTIPSHGDPCQRDTDCVTKGGQRGASSMSAMKCRQPDSFDYTTDENYSGTKCQCESNDRTILAGYVISNAIATRQSGNNLVNVPLRLNLTNEKVAPVAYWCLSASAFKFTPTGYLGGCNLDPVDVPQKEFRYCSDGLVCEHFPVDENDNSTTGRCIPRDQNDIRWYGSEKQPGRTGGSGSFYSSSSNNNNSSSSQGANDQSYSTNIRSGADNQNIYCCQLTMAFFAIVLLLPFW